MTIEIKSIGQKFKRRDGIVVTVDRFDIDDKETYPWGVLPKNTCSAEDREWYTTEGKYIAHGVESHDKDLIELVIDDPVFVSDADAIHDDSTVKTTAERYLLDAATIMAERGKQYDSPQGERSMGKTVAAFNAVTGRDLTESEGWLLMLLLKQVRQFQNAPHLDSAQDAVAYAALLAEARMGESL